MHIFMANFKMRANTCTYFQNGGPLRSSAQNIDILSGSNRSGSTGHSIVVLWYYRNRIFLPQDLHRKWFNFWYTVTFFLLFPIGFKGNTIYKSFLDTILSLKLSFNEFFRKFAHFWRFLHKIWLLIVKNCFKNSENITASWNWILHTVHCSFWNSTTLLHTTSWAKKIPQYKIPQVILGTVPTSVFYNSFRLRMFDLNTI